MSDRTADAALVLAWFVLAGFVLIRLLQEPAQVDAVLAAWLGGVLSVFAYQLVRRRFR